VRRVGAIPTEYVYYFYDGRRYLDEVARAGASRGRDVLRLNEELLSGLSKAFVDSSVDTAWSVYDTLLGVRRDTYMRTDMRGDSGQGEARARRAAQPAPGVAEARIGGYEGLALRVIDGLSGGTPRELIINTRNTGGAGPGGRPLDFLAPDDVVEVRARVTADGVTPLPGPRLPLHSQALVAQVKEYERGVVEAAMTGDAGLAGVALSLHPLVPGITAARELIAEYRSAHGPYLAYLR
jgi:6-phospho-beta-glucosidase